MGACADDLGVVHHGGCVHLDELVIRYRGLVGVSLIRGSLIRGCPVSVIYVYYELYA